MAKDNEFTLADDDFVTVCLGKGQEKTGDFTDHPRVQWLDAATLNGQDPINLPDTISQKSKIVILTEGISHEVYHQLTAHVRRRHLIYQHRQGPRAVNALLHDLFPLSEKPSFDEPPHKTKDRLKRFLAEYPPDLTKGSAEEARRLFEIAKKVGVITTTQSIAQSISKMKRGTGHGDIPASARVKNPRGDALQLIDDTIVQLQLLREWIVQTTDENADLRRSRDVILDALKLTQAK